MVSYCNAIKGTHAFCTSILFTFSTFYICLEILVILRIFLRKWLPFLENAKRKSNPTLSKHRHDFKTKNVTEFEKFCCNFNFY